jgi:anti-sigma-K factor RskA
MNQPIANNPELDALLGAYALDALDDDERARVDAYIAGNPQARREVDDLRESASSLALAPVDDLTASSELWDKIATKIADEPRNVVPLVSRRERRMSSATMSILAIAAVFIAVLGLAGGIVIGNRGDDSGNLASAFDEAAATAGARQVALTDDGATLAQAVVLPDGSGFLKNERLAALPDGETYQLWAVSGPANEPVVISAGVMGGDPDTVAFHTSPDVNTLGLTVEREPGVVASQNPMVAAATVA